MHYNAELAGCRGQSVIIGTRFRWGTVGGGVRFSAQNTRLNASQNFLHFPFLRTLFTSSFIMPLVRSRMPLVGFFRGIRVAGLFFLPVVQGSFFAIIRFFDKVAILKRVWSIVVDSIYAWGIEFAGMISKPHKRHISFREQKFDTSSAIPLETMMFRIRTALARALPDIVPGILFPPQLHFFCYLAAMCFGPGIGLFSDHVLISQSVQFHILLISFWIIFFPKECSLAANLKLFWGEVHGRSITNNYGYVNS